MGTEVTLSNLNSFDLEPEKTEEQDLKNIVKNIKFPHYQVLRINTKDILSLLSNEYSLYNKELQNSLLKFEKSKMPITVDYLCHNSRIVFKNMGGTISMGLCTDKIESASCSQNKNSFSALKAFSVYNNYIFGDVNNDNILSVYGGIYYLFPELKSVKTYTIVYVIAKQSMREVTLHDFSEYGTILTTLELDLEKI